MFRRHGSSKGKVEPEVCVLLRNLNRYPGDTLQGVAVVDFASPMDVLALEARLSGEERATLGGLLITEKNPEARKTLYYEQFVTLRGAGRDVLEHRRDRLGRRRTVVSQDALNPKPNPASAVAAKRTSISAANGDEDYSSQEVPSAENSTFDVSAVVANTGATPGAVHLSPGTYSFPFKVQLPDTLPPSRELSRAREGTAVLRYSVTVRLILMSGKVYTAEARFRVNPLPVQIQRWYELHKDEQNSPDTLERDDADPGFAAEDDERSHVGIRSRLMSSAGTVRADAADRDRDVTCQRRLRHYRQFPDDQLEAERAEHAKLAEAREAEKSYNQSISSPLFKDKASRRASAAGSPSKKQHRPKSLRARRAKEDANDNRSLDGERGQNEEAAAADAVEDGDEVHAFDAGENEDESHPLQPHTNGTGSADEANSNNNNNTSSRSSSRKDDNAASPHSPDKKRKHRNHHHNGGVGVGDGSVGSSKKKSALVTDNVEQLAFTPPGEEVIGLPTPVMVHTTEESTTDKWASFSHKNSHAARSTSRRDELSENEKEGDQKTQSGTQAHHRRSRANMPPWNQEFSISLRGGFLHSGKVKVKLTLRSPLITVGTSKIVANLVVDNSEGSGNITRLKYTLITRCYIRTKTEVYNFHTEQAEVGTEVNIEKGKVVAVPTAEIPVPKSAPLTLLTEGMGTLSFLNVRFYASTTLKTFSKSIETEVMLLSGQDSQNNSRRLLGWSCFYRRRDKADTRDLTIRPPTLDFSEQNAKMRVMEAADVTRPSSALVTGDGDTTSMAPSAISHSLSLLRSSKRIAKEAPSMDARRLASALNYDEAIFIPSGDESGPSFHMDPISMLNPLAAPPSDVGSTLPSADPEIDSPRH